MLVRVRAFTVTELPLRLHRVEADPFLDPRWGAGRGGERVVATGLPATAHAGLVFESCRAAGQRRRGEFAD